ncbi:post-GPI attachment to proteins factor 2-like [Rhopilema esculentum]|uniref:post-GPI attachment to proteins factor 2-like n=1 Tax=Rhopilema esculentum TaxID=499914 RepID=UPI0031DBA577
MATMNFRRVDTSMNDVIRVKFSSLAKIVLFFPCASLFSCVFVSFLLHWDEVTSTHCKVPNYLPSLSAAIGDYTPERYIWRIGIALHSFGRYMVAAIYMYFYTQLSIGKKSWFFSLAVLNFFLNLLEIFSLLVLSYVSSTENFEVHEAAFISFIVFSMSYMVITSFLMKTLAGTEKSDKLYYSYQLKLRLLVMYIFFFGLSVYFYFRHNGYCEPGVYSLFALCEYIVVIINIGFHVTGILDFEDSYITVGPLFNVVDSTSEKYR